MPPAQVQAQLAGARHDLEVASHELELCHSRWGGAGALVKPLF